MRTVLLTALIVGVVGATSTTVTQDVPAPRVRVCVVHDGDDLAGGRFVTQLQDALAAAPRYEHVRDRGRCAWEFSLVSTPVTQNTGRATALAVSVVLLRLTVPVASTPDQSSERPATCGARGCLVEQWAIAVPVSAARFQTPISELLVRLDEWVKRLAAESP